MSFAETIGNTEQRRQPSLLDLPLNKLIFVAFDTETTGRHPLASRLVEVSGVKFRGNGEGLETKTHLINPETPIPEEVTAIHGITDDMVQGMPNYRTVVPEFISWAMARPQNCEAEHTVLVAHNAAFDIGFLQMALSKLRLPLPANPVLDTLSLSRKLIKDAPNHKLKTLMEHLGLGSSTYHRAEADSFHVQALLLSIFSRLPADSTLADLIACGGVLYFSDPAAAPDDAIFLRDPLVKQIGQAIRSGQDLQISYSGKGIRMRQITPLSVLNSGGLYYLSAFCHAAADERTFRVDRISSLELVERGNLLKM